MPVISSHDSGCRLAFSRVAGALGLLALAACGGGGDGGEVDCDPIAAALVSRIEVTPATTSVADGQSLQLVAKAYSCDGSQLTVPSFAWTTSDATTVSVNASGMVLGEQVGGPVTVTASVQGKQGTARISVAPRSVASVRIDPSVASVAVGRTSTLVAVALDAEGNELPGRTATWSGSNDALLTVSAGGAITGVAAGGPVTVTATIEGQVGTAQVTVVNAAVATVTVTPATSTIAAGSTVQLSAVLRDDQGNVLTGRAILWSTTDAVRASVSNTGLVTGLSAGPVSILATSEERTGSADVTITPAPGVRVVFLVQPTTTAAGANITPAVQVEIQNTFGARVTTSSASVTLSLAANPGAGTLSGTTTVNAVNGVATFSNLRINQPAAGYTLAAASSGLSGATSSAFNIVAGPPASLRFVVQPGDVGAGQPIAPIQVELLDSQGNVSTSATSQVTLDIGDNPGGATLSGVARVNAVAGVATFTGLSLNRVGGGYTLVAESGELPPAASNAFTVTAGPPASLTFVSQPNSTGAGTPIAPPVQLEVRDAFGNLVTTPTQVSIAIGNNPGGATLGGTTAVNTVNGVATFNDLTLDLAAAGYTLTASAAGLGATSSEFEVTPGPAVSVRFSVAPSNIQETAPFAPEVAVEVRDALGNRATGYAGNVSLQLRSSTGGGAGAGNQLVNGGSRPFVQGVAVFSALTVNFTGIVLAPRTFTLRTNSSFPQVLSTAFDVSPF